MYEKTPVTSQEPAPSAEARKWAMLTHLAAFAAFLMPFGNVIGPFVVWQLKKELSPFVDQQGKEAINFQITVILAVAVCLILFFAVVGVLLVPLLGLAWFVLNIIAAIKTNDGVAYRYPLTIRFLK